jgi:hypothetical protein
LAARVLPRRAQAVPLAIEPVTAGRLPVSLSATSCIQWPARFKAKGAP